MVFYDKKRGVGVIIARFQTAKPHAAHRALYDYVAKRHGLVVYVIGVSPTRGTKRDPLDFESRRQLVNSEFPNAGVVAMPDHGSDRVWSANLDKTLTKTFRQCLGRQFKLNQVTLYGGRDSFIPHYYGGLKTHVVRLQMPDAATTLRDAIGKAPPIASEEFRRGVIYSSQKQFPRVFQCVDIAVTRRNAYGKGPRLILLGRKHKHDLLRFPGGFVDPTDDSLEYAAKRELGEEAPNISVEGDLDFVTSQLVDDWRYRDTDRIMTALFHGEYTFGNSVAGDDLTFVGWFPLNEKTRKQMFKPHALLFTKLLSYLNSKQGEKSYDQQSQEF